MSNRPSANDTAPPGPTVHSGGIPARYSPVRSPLVSMGPSLAEIGRRRAVIRRTTLVLSGIAIAMVIVVQVAIMLTREVTVEPPAVQAATGSRNVLLVPTGRPRSQVVAAVKSETVGEADLRLQLPIHSDAVTAVGYSSARGLGALVLTPEGHQGNITFLERLSQRFLATKQVAPISYYLIDGTREPKLLYVGAPAGAQVYAPLEGTIMVLADYILNGGAYGVEMHIQPTGDPQTIVVLRGIEPAANIAVGQSVSLGSTLIGTVHDLGGAQKQELSRFSHDSGSALELFVQRIKTDQLTQ